MEIGEKFLKYFPVNFFLGPSKHVKEKNEDSFHQHSAPPVKKSKATEERIHDFAIVA